jgi:hypothetical protein
LDNSVDFHFVDFEGSDNRIGDFEKRIERFEKRIEKRIEEANVLRNNVVVVWFPLQLSGGEDFSRPSPVRKE